MSIETIRDDVRHVVAKAGFLSTDEATDAVLDLICDELGGNGAVEVLARGFAAGCGDKCFERDLVGDLARRADYRDGARAAIAALVETIGGSRG